MGYDFERTHNLILESAKKHFLDNGFSGASVRQICSDAGVTNGAFYSHFDSKENLFADLVEPVLNGLNNLYDDETDSFTSVRSAKEFEKVLQQALVSDSALIHCLYENEDIFRLILTSSKDTQYENFTENLARNECKWTMEFLNNCKPFIKRPENITESIIIRMSKFVIDTVFDCFLEGKTEEETIRQTQLASEFCIAGLKTILGI